MSIIGRLHRTAVSPIVRVPTVEHMTILRMDNVGIVFDDLVAAGAFFVELGLELQGKMKAEGEWSDRDQYAGAMCALHALSGALEECTDGWPELAMARAWPMISNAERNSTSINAISSSSTARGRCPPRPG